MTASADRDQTGVRDAVAKEVSVFCTAKNAAATIEQTVASILAQEFQNWEMIVVDDGSTDDTVGVVRRIAQADPRIKVVATGGVGRGRALNRALAEAKADLVANIDADDLSHPSRLRYEVEAMKQHPEFAIISTDRFRFYGAARPNWPDIGRDTFEVADVTRALAISNPICHSSAMVRKAAIIGLGGYSEDNPTQDYDLWVRSAAAGLRVGRIELPLTAKRIHTDQFFAHSMRLPCLIASAQIQLRAVRVLGVGRRYLPLIALRFLWGILPQRVRFGVRDLKDRRSSGTVLGPRSARR